MMEQVTLFELGWSRAAGQWSRVERAVIQQTGVKETIGGVEHPDGDEHCGG
jgi:hypothetical protein